MIGPMTSGMQIRTTLVSFGLVIKRNRVPPSIISRLRSAIEAEEPITD